MSGSPRNVGRVTFTAALIIVVAAATPGTCAKQHVTSVAITTMAPAAAERAQKDALAKLGSLIELEASGQTGIAVVERMEIGAALQELVLNRSLQVDEANRLQLEKLTSANLIVTLRLLPPNENRRHFAALQIVESLTGTIRGAIAVPMAEAMLEDAAVEAVQYLKAVIESPQTAAVTIAVGPFESVGPFDRQRSLELGVPELIVARLLRSETFRVVQRANMQQLVDEIELIRSGLADSSQLPETLPSRAATYFLHGTIAERRAANNSGKPQLAIAANLIRVETGKIVLGFQLNVAHDELPPRLATKVDDIANYLAAKSGVPAGSIKEIKFDETQHLFELAIRDVSRLIWRGPQGYGYLPFTIPGYTVSSARSRPSLYEIEALAAHLIRKSIDRLETVLYIEPERSDAAFALAYCYSFHVKDSWQPERAEELYRRAFQRNPNSRLARQALNRMAAMYFHHGGNYEIENEHIQPAIRCCLFELTELPSEKRDEAWAGQFSTLAFLYRRADDYAALGQAILLAARLAAESDSLPQEAMANQVSHAATGYVRRQLNPAELRTAVRQLLTNWSESDSRSLRCHGSRALAELAEAENQLLLAAELYARAAAALDPGAGELQERNRTRMMTNAARCYREAGKPAEGVALLRSFTPQNQPLHFEFGFYGYELGRCYEELGDSSKALETFVDFAEAGRGLCWNTDVAERIEELGGVPLRPDREIDVRYVAGPDEKPFYCRSLATDGRRLYCGGGYIEEHVNSAPIRGIETFDLELRQWKPLGGPQDRISALAHDSGQLWAGTDSDGLWRCEMETTRWKAWRVDDGLPENSITGLAVKDRTAFLGVGVRNSHSIVSGGVVRIDPAGEVKPYDQPDAPIVAPQYLVVNEDAVFVSSQHRLFELNRKTDRWRQHPRAFCSSVLQVESGLWLSRCRQEIYRWGASAEQNQKYSKAWFPHLFGCYQVRFALERGGQLWFGGGPWREFLSHGFYRLDTVTGDFRMYGARDGFKIGKTPSYECYDGVWAADRIWLATSFGLAEVTIRDVVENVRRSE